MFIELKCLIGVLIMAGVRHDAPNKTCMMWDNQYLVGFYKALFSKKRFEFLMRALRFDDRDTRADRLAGGDKICSHS